MSRSKDTVYKIQQEDFHGNADNKYYQTFEKTISCPPTSHIGRTEKLESFFDHNDKQMHQPENMRASQRKRESFPDKCHDNASPPLITVSTTTRKTTTMMLRLALSYAEGGNIDEQTDRASGSWAKPFSQNAPASSTFAISTGRCSTNCPCP